MNKKNAAEMRNPWARFPVTSPYQELNDNIRNMVMAKMDSITEKKVSRYVPALVIFFSKPNFRRSTLAPI